MSQGDLFGGFSPSPEAGLGLRYYQEEAEAAIRSSLEGNRSALTVMATGLGKTQVFCAIAAGWDGNVLVLAHRSELVDQARNRLEVMTGEMVETEQADERSHRGRLVVGSVDTVKQPKRLERLGKDRFDLIVTDEAHHYVAPSYRRPLDFFENAKLLGVTATPDRSDESALGQIFDDVPFIMDIEDGIDAGYLVPLRGVEVFLEQVDLSLVKARAGDLAVNELDEQMAKAAEAIVDQTLEIAPGRRGVAFLPGVRSAEYTMNAFNRRVPGSACFISGQTEWFERKRIVDDFRAGRYQYLCNCQVATEGFDAPGVDLIIQGRPTLSRALYAQMVGRGTRPLPGVVDHIPGRDGGTQRRASIASSAKQDCLVLDFVGNAGKHSLMTVVDVLGGNYTPAEVEAAKKKTKGGGNPQQALQDARRELQALAQAARVSVKASKRTFDPFGLLHIKEDARMDRFGAVPASDKQKAALLKLGVPDADKLTKGQASRLLSTMFGRMDKKLASLKQLSVLSRAGVDQPNIYFSNASKGIDYLASNQWGRGPKYQRKILMEILKGR